MYSFLWQNIIGPNGFIENLYYYPAIKLHNRKHRLVLCTKSIFLSGLRNVYAHTFGNKPHLPLTHDAVSLIITSLKI